MKTPKEARSRKTAATIVVYDPCCRESFIRACHAVQAKDYKAIDDPRFFEKRIFMIGDVAGSQSDNIPREVSFEEATEGARSSFAQYFEVSSSTGYNFETLIQKLISPNLRKARSINRSQRFKLCWEKFLANQCVSRVLFFLAYFIVIVLNFAPL